MTQIPTPTKARVLFIEDIVDCVVILARILRYLFDDVEWVQDIPAAIEKIRQGTPDIILIDGYFLNDKASMQKIHKEYAGLVIGIVGSKEETNARQCDFYFYKPVDIGKFSVVLREIAERLQVSEIQNVSNWLAEKQEEIKTQ